MQRHGLCLFSFLISPLSILPDLSALFQSTNTRRNNMNEIEVLEPEVVGKQLVEVEQASGVEQDTALALRGQFADFYNAIVEWRGKAAMVTQPEDATHQKIAREVRLGLKKVRCDVENTRKALKADSLARSKAIDGFANVLKYLCEPIENKLMEVEQYAERQEAARIAALVADRMAALMAVDADPTAYNLGVMTEEIFVGVLHAATQTKADRDRLAAQAEADIIAREKAEADERERIRKENERLKKEAAKRDAELKAEREAKEKAEREAADAKRKEADRIAAEKAAEEAKAKADKEAKRKAARAPDKKKLESFADAIDEICPPEMATDEGAAVMNDAVCQMKDLTQWLRDAARVM